MTIQKKIMRRKRTSPPLLCEFDIRPLKFKIFGDMYCYILKLYQFYEEKKEWTERNTWYYPSIEYVFKDLIDVVLKERMATAKNKTLEEMANVIKQTREDIVKMFEKFKDLKNPEKII